MCVTKVTISAVSYLNTKPFIYGLQKSGLAEKIDLQLDIPSVCAEKLLNNEVAIALAPVAILKQIRNYQIVSNYGIACDGAVNSVMLYSEVPLHEIETIYLDYQSRTSVELIKILCSELWKIKPNFLSAQVGYEKKITGRIAGLVIGDRTFFLNDTFKYVYDLGSEWKRLTQLPFVFACWITQRNIEKTILKEFNSALESGIANINNLTAEIDLGQFNNIDFNTYFTQFLNFSLTEKHHQGRELFLNYIH